MDLSAFFINRREIMSLKQNELQAIQNEYAKAYNTLASELQKRGMDINLLIQIDKSLRKLLKS